jgi:hypothetical protein
MWSPLRGRDDGLASAALAFIAERDIPNALAQLGEGDFPVYEPRWDRRLQKVVKAIQAGETDLSRVIARAAEGVGREALGGSGYFVWLGERASISSPLFGAQRRALFNSIIQRQCGPETESIVELGAGDGLNLFKLWLSGTPRDARYMAFEIASTGRLCTELLGKLEPAMRVSAHAYDYYSPKYSDIPRGQKHMLVFTAGSIEQIRELPKRVISDLLGKAQEVSGVHFEPVGWQLSDDPLSQAGKRHSLAHGYNENLAALLRELEQEGTIAIDRTLLNIFGKVKRPSTLIQWHKVG